MEDHRQKFQELLYNLFQFESADLDFGIYRIMNFRRDAIEKFITQDLLDAVSAELSSGVLAAQSEAARQLQEVAGQVREMLGNGAVDGDGNLAEAYHNLPIGKKYLDLHARARGARSRAALEAIIFNHLYTFFSRYYDAGDFMSRRRYSRREKYAVPYNGEEVYLHWANKDQYYIKTAEYFTDYTFVSHGITVHFKLQAADVEQNNVKGDKRFFLPSSAQAAFDDAARQVIIPFEYRPLSQQEEIRYGSRNQQDAIIAEALDAIPKRFAREHAALAALVSERRKTDAGESVSYLEHHLHQYTRRNTSDFFIHKNLGGFLERELDFYLKNEVLNVDELEAAGEARAEAWFQIMRILKSIGRKVIAFLAQIEDFQKKLFEKRKFVLQTHYCIAVGHIPEEFYPQIATNEAQREEWVRLFAIDTLVGDLVTPGYSIPLTPGFLKTHPTLMLDTRHFGQSFIDRLLGSFDDIDEITDGVLVHSENWQGLNLLLERYRQCVQCIHIDPPYNTQTSGFLYKNNYQHSSWLAMMQDRVSSSLGYLRESAIFACHIDESEVENLHFLLDRSNLVNAGTLVWNKGMPTTGAVGLAMQHEYVLFCSSSPKTTIRVRKKNISLMHNKIQELLEQFGSPTKDAIAQYRKWLRSQTGFARSERTYNEFDETGKAFRSDNMSATDRRTNPKFYIPLKHPATKQDCPVPEYGWRYTPESMRKLLEDDLILFGEDHTTMPRKKTYIENTSDSQMPSVFTSGSRGKTSLDSLGLEFTFAHPFEFYSYILESSTGEGGLVLDFFAGSGTTAHAIINLDREDASRRKFILMEMADYFDTVLLPRIKKVTYSPEWKNGMPVRQPTREETERGPRIVKYLRLESYEDALDNIASTSPTGQMTFQFDDYVLNYMLDWETRDSDTFLNVEKLASPFSYTLHVVQDGQTQEKPVDLPETFNYLFGLHVQTRRVHHDGDRHYLVYRGTVDHHQIVVIWREIQGWEKADFERDKQFVDEHKIAEGADEILVNGDSFIPCARSLDPIFKSRMFAPIASDNGGN